MNKNSIVFIGLDTHKEFFEVAHELEGRDEHVIHDGRISSAKASVIKMVRDFQSKYPQATLHFVYEAGPCGYWIYRLLTSLGHCCYVVAPSLLPKKPGERVKTDRKDAMKLAHLLKINDVPIIYVPEAEDEAVRDLSRARQTATNDLNHARLQLKGFLLRNNIRYDGTANWSAKHIRWLNELILPHPAQHIVLQEMLHTIDERMRRLARLVNELEHQVKQWRYYPVVKAIQAMRGIRFLVAASLIAELGDLRRFDTPRKLMKYLGLTPKEESSGDHRRLGKITKCGNGRARRLLIEGAHAYKHPPKVSTEIQKRQEMLSKEVIDIAWQAQLRLCRRYQRLIHRGKHRNLVVTAIAREMIAYIWAISREIAIAPIDVAKRKSRVPA
ncbi:IS110 family transposase [Pseudoalteromonas phenolica]|uniref:IS110 family transposase n=1 Tax=Pseudoalteromonas phenolica TaxID=161398 RepID=A0A4Q7IHT9_9GAMM|nr:IS110 family transposase [Pseudoalteromonas phenolica]RZQ51624.1 IS110 family transposase [Pseudoalteromonas phenolica]